MSNNNGLEKRSVPRKANATHEDISKKTVQSRQSHLRKFNGAFCSFQQRQEIDDTVASSASQRVLISRSVRAISCKDIWLHGVSIACSAAVISLCANEIYFKDIDASNINVQLNAFQVVAALHGTLVGLSLGTIAVDHMLYELCRRKGLPLGYMMLPFQLSSVLIPFRTKFWAAMFSDTLTVRKVVFGVSIVTAVILQALIGPSSAILIVPQLEFWDNNHPFGSTDGFTFFNQSHDFMWPTYINVSLVDPICNGTGVLMREQCPYANMGQVRSWGADYRDQFLVSNITAIDDANQLRYISSSPPDDRYLGYSASTTAMAHVARDFGDIWSYAQRHQNDGILFGSFRRPKLLLLPTSLDKQTMRPMVQIQCAAPVDITNSTDENFQVMFPSGHLQEKQSNKFINVSVAINATHFRDRPVVAEFRDLSIEASHPASGVLFGMQFVHASAIFGQNFTASDGTGLVACSIVAHWIPTNLTSDPTTSNIITMDNPYPREAAENTELMSRAIPMIFDLAYLDKVNLKVTNNNANVLEYNTRGLTVQGSRYRLYEGTWGSRWPWILSTLVSVQLTDALARVNLDSRMYVFCQSCADKDSRGAKNQVHDLYAQNVPGNTYAEPRTAAQFKADITAQPEHFAPVRWQVQRYGYGWGLNQITKELAVATIAVHTVLVLAHVMLSMVRRTRFEAWTEFPQFLALVNQSPALDVLRDLGVGVVDKHRYGENISIRVSPSDDDKRGRAVLTTSQDLIQVKSGVVYG